MKLVKLIRKLNSINRCALFPLVKPTTVSEHSFHVSVLALFILEDLKALGREVNELKVLKHALLHDVEESIISDIPFTVKLHIKDSLNEALRIMGGEQMPEAPEWLLEEVHATCDGSPEWLITKAADMLELLCYCKDEEMLGNRNLEDMYNRAWQVLEGLAVRINSPWLDSMVMQLKAGE